MTSTPISYNVVKVSELEDIGRLLNGNDELVVNDTSTSPVETKKCGVEAFASAIKIYVLPIATETELGGIKVGDGLTINETTGVLSNEKVILSSLDDIDIFNPQQNDVLFYDAVKEKWVNTDPTTILPIYSGGNGIEVITDPDNSTAIINAKPGQGIRISNDEIATDLGRGLRIINDKNEVELGDGLIFDGN